MLFLWYSIIKKVFVFKYLTIVIILMFSTLSWGQDCLAPKQIPIEEYNPQETLICPIIVVDKMGNQEWKYPPKKEEPKPTVKEVKEEYYFYKGKPQGYNLEVTAALTGYFVGASVGGYYRSNHWSFGGNFRYYNFSSLEGVSGNTMLVTGVVNYHFMPRVYTHSPSHKKYDLGLRVLGGYNLVQSTEDEALKSGPIIGMGGFVSYPMWEKIRVIGSAEVFQSVSGFSPMGSAFSIGISYDF